MDKIIVPLLGLSLTLILLIVYLIISSKNKKEAVKSNENSISQFFINIMDIENDILYGLDGYKRVFVEVEPVNIDLLNNADIQRLIKELSSEISKLNLEFDLFAISRPFNVDKLKTEYEDCIYNANTDIQRALLRNSLSQILSFGQNGDVVERKFYFVVQGLENEAEIIKQAELITECFKSSNIQCYRLDSLEIKRLINLFNNIDCYNYDVLEDTNNSIPLIKQDLKKKKTLEEKLKEKEEVEKEERIDNIEKEKETNEEEKN